MKKLVENHGGSEHITVSAEERQNILIEQSHRPTLDQEKQQRSFGALTRTQSFLVCHTELNYLYHNNTSQETTCIRRLTLPAIFTLSELSLSMPSNNQAPCINRLSLWFKFHPLECI